MVHILPNPCYIMSCYKAVHQHTNFTVMHIIGDNHRKQDSDSPGGPCDSNGQKMQADAQLDSASGETADGTYPPSG